MSKLNQKRGTYSSKFTSDLTGDQCVSAINKAFTESKGNIQTLQIVKSAVKSRNRDSSIEQQTDRYKSISTQQKGKKLLLCIQACRYDVVKRVARNMDMKVTEDENADWDIYWSDINVQPDRISKLRPFQRINASPNISVLARKNNLAINLMRMQQVYKDDYSYFPKTWLLPQDSEDLRNQFDKKDHKTFIIKPSHMCQGRGIYLVRRFEDIKMEPDETCIAQRYMTKPYLIDGLKFDLRIYVLVFGVDPLRVFIFKEGLARFATDQYIAPGKGNLNNMFMHLTNYAINKNSDAFVEGNLERDGHKRSLSMILQYLEQNEQGFCGEKLMDQIEDIAVKTCLSCQPALAQAYRTCQPDDVENSMCFQILGLDIILDHQVRPWLLEVNHLSSFGTDSPLDDKIKFDLISDTFKLLNLSVKRKIRTKQERVEQFSKRMHKESSSTQEQRSRLRETCMRERDQFESNHLGNFRKAFPNDDPSLQQKYECLLETAQELFSKKSEFKEGQFSNFNGNSTRANLFTKNRTVEIATRLTQPVVIQQVINQDDLVQQLKRRTHLISIKEKLNHGQRHFSSSQKVVENCISKEHLEAIKEQISASKEQRTTFHSGRDSKDISSKTTETTPKCVTKSNVQKYQQSHKIVDRLTELQRIANETNLKKPPLYDNQVGRLTQYNDVHVRKTKSGFRKILIHQTDKFLPLRLLNDNSASKIQKKYPRLEVL